MLSALFFNRSAAARLLGCKPERLVKFEIWRNVIFAQVKGQRPTFISKADFYGEFYRFRQQGAKSCQVREFSAGCYPGSFDVKSEDRWHHVRLNLGCSCPDYQEQKAQNLPHPRCKHQYAVMNYLGVSSLEEAIAKVQATYEPDWRESAPVIKPPVTVSPRPLPGQYAHVSIA